MNKVVDRIENMTKRTKLILSLVGISAVIVPAILLLVISKNTKSEPQVVNSKRSVDAQNIEKTAKTVPTPNVIASPTPKSGSSSASPKQSTNSAQ